MTLWALTLSDSKQRASARSCPRPLTPPVSQMADSCDSSEKKSGLMSLRSFQRRQKIMLLLKMAGRNMAKNNTWSPLSAVVSMMGGGCCARHFPLAWDLYLPAAPCSCRRQSQESRRLLVASASPRSRRGEHAILFPFNTFSDSSLSRTGSLLHPEIRTIIRQIKSRRPAMALK